MIEMMYVVVVIGILATMALPSYQDRVIRSQVREALGLAEMAKEGVENYFSSNNGQMPENNTAAGLPEAEVIVGNYTSQVKINQGAIELTLGNRINKHVENKVVTLRPNITAEQGWEYTKTDNWLKLMSDDSLGLAGLRINFANFGGEEGVEKIADFLSAGDEDREFAPRGPKEEGWTSIIITLLKSYPKTYADLAAFDWKDSKAVSALLWILAWDEAGKFDVDQAQDHKIIDKIAVSNPLKYHFNTSAGEES